MHGMQKVRWIRNGIGAVLVGAGWSTGGLVIPGGVDGELADEFAGGGVDYADGRVPDEHQGRGRACSRPDRAASPGPGIFGVVAGVVG
jgi:hypothetical protein